MYQKDWLYYDHNPCLYKCSGILDVCFEMLEHKNMPPSKKPKQTLTKSQLISYHESSKILHAILQIFVAKKKNTLIEILILREKKALKIFLVETVRVNVAWLCGKPWKAELMLSTRCWGYFQTCKWVSLSLGPSLHGKELRERKKRE